MNGIPNPKEVLIDIARSPSVRPDSRLEAVRVLHEFRLSSAVKVCISCGMPQNHDGTLPCDH